MNILGYTAALAAYQNGESWLRAIIDYLRINHELVFSMVNGMNGLSMNRAEATYLAWIDVRSLHKSDHAGFFEKAGVGLSDGRDFGMEGFVRLNFACPGFRLKTALDRMTAAVQ